MVMVNGVVRLQQRSKRAESDKKYNAKNRERRKVWARAQYLKEKGLGMNRHKSGMIHYQVPLKINKGIFTLTFD